MNFNKIAILTSQESWFVPYSRQLVNELLEEHFAVGLFFDHESIDSNYEIVFILSYFRIINKSFLKEHKHNLVVHESDLPHGKGWAPLFWQVLEGKNEIPVVLFEANECFDSGDIYLKDYILLDPTDLHDIIREKQALKTIELCRRFLNEYTSMNPAKQIGSESIYLKRSAKDSELDINKTIKEQFDLIRICDNEKYPAFFDYQGVKYKIQINKII